MPYKIVKTDHKVKVVNKATGRVHAKGTTKAKAEAQVRLMRGVEHGWEATGKKVRKAQHGVIVGGHYGGVGPKLATGPPPPAKPQVIRTTKQVITGRS